MAPAGRSWLDAIRDTLFEGASAAALAAVSGHHNVFGVLGREGEGDRLRPWRPGDRLPVVFCHGYMGDATNFVLLRRRLYGAGFKSQAAVWLWPFWRSCAEYAALIERRVAAVLERTGAPAADLVAHSMGGLAGRRLLAGSGGAGDGVRRLVTIGSPHRGTVAALAGPGASALDLRPGSAFLRGLDGDLALLGAGRVLSIYGGFDWIAPPATAHVPPPQENLHFPGLGHSALLLSRRVASAVAAALPAASRRSDALPSAPSSASRTAFASALSANGYRS